MSLCPAVVIDNPTQYAPHKFGFFSTTHELTNVPPHWESCGILWESETCVDDAGVWTESCGENLSPMSGGESSVGEVTADSFLLHARWACAAIGRTPEQHRAAALRALACSEQRVIETRFYNEFLVSPDTIALNTTGTAVTLASGIGLLEGALGATQCGEPYLHMPRELGALASRFNQTYGAGGVLRTALGSPMAFGVGYGNVAPDGTPPPLGVAWIYGTGPSYLLRGAPFMNPPSFEDALNRETNEVIWWAQRRNLLALDACLSFAVAVVVGCECPGGGGGGVGLNYPSPG